MASNRLVAIAAPLRCALDEHLTLVGVPFRAARWRAPGNVSAPWVAVCDHHRRPLDVPVGADEPVLVVTIELRVELAGRYPDVALARTEAVAALEKQLAAIGARLEVAAVSSEVVQVAAQPAQPAKRSAGGAVG